MKKIMDLKYSGKHFVCKVDDKDSNNPYKLYREYYEATEHGSAKHSLMISKYADLGSVMYKLFCMVNFDAGKYMK